MLFSFSPVPRATAVSSSLHWPLRLDSLLPYEYLVYDVSKPLNRAIALSSTVQDVCTWARPRRRRTPTLPFLPLVPPIKPVILLPFTSALSR